MNQPYHIAIAGIGGVGGYYGALLAHTYQSHPALRISFIARGQHMQAIKDNGLLLEREAGNITARPHHITDNPEELGPLDLIIFCCKGYDLPTLAASFASNITANTVLLPLLNGVGATQVLQQLYPQAQVLYGCTYLVSKITEPGTVKMMGEMNQLLLGNPALPQAQLENIETVLKATGANVSLHQNILEKVWEKFSFISPIATATSALDSSIDVIMASPEKKGVLSALMQEILLLAAAEGIHLPPAIINSNLARAAKMPPGATSSMHNDFKNYKNTELEMLTGHVVHQAQKHRLSLPTYAQLYASLKERK